ncbi:MAG TPA: endonuclease/exonuclease/phosphatase family protein [Alphaproteobacteria bacterium]|nr:endonuclease/exonuclease/phosphatase family protein [Alphaproteobacteria bacterium]
MSVHRLVVWNILEGMLKARHPADGRRHPDPPRREAGRALIARLEPDLLVLNEALHCEPVYGQHEDYAALFGLPHQFARLYDGSWGNAILSRWPILETRERLITRRGPQQDRNLLAARIALPAGPVWIVTYHPHPQRRPHNRALDFDGFLPELEGEMVLAGDLNAISPEDGVDAAALAEAFAGFQRPDVAQASVTRILESGTALFRDTFPRHRLRDAVPPHARGHTIPTPMLSTDLSSAMRIDHILATPGIRIHSAGPIRAPEADIASDHYPVEACFSLAGASGP